MYVEVKELSGTMRKVLEAAGYARKDIEVIAAEEIDIGSGGATGERAFAYVVNLATGEYKGTVGSWGGPNMFTRTNIVDNGGIVKLPEHGAVVKGSMGRSVFATIYCHPQSMGNMLPSGEPVEELTNEEQQAIYCFGALKGGEYRREELRRRRVSEGTIDSLVERGYLKRNKAGATQITTKGKNARTIRY